jgi:hypothetical protein
MQKPTLLATLFGALAVLVTLVFFHNESSTHSSLTDATDSVNAQLANTITSSSVYFDWNKTTASGVLRANSSSRQQILAVIASKLNLILSVDEKNVPTLQDRVSLELTSDIDVILRSVLNGIKYSIIKASPNSNSSQNLTWLCVGNHICPTSSNVGVTDTAPNPPTHEFDKQPSKELLAAMTSGTPSNAVGAEALVEKSRVLRTEFPHASKQTKIAILKALDVESLDTAFAAEVLRFDQDIDVRVTAAQRLSFANSGIAIDALRKALDDREAVVSITALNLLHRDEDETLRREIARDIANHPSQAVRQAAKELGYID